MNPTLSARLRSWRQDRYWRTHPSAPWPVPVEPATALLHQVLPVPAAATPELAEEQLALHALVAIPAVVPVETVCPDTVCLEMVCVETVRTPRPAEVLAEAPAAAGAHRSPPDSLQRQGFHLLLAVLVTLMEGWLALRGLLRQIVAIWGTSAAVSRPCRGQRQRGGVRRGTCVPLFAQEVVQEAP
jgi:hypothetical protein